MRGVRPLFYNDEDLISKMRVAWEEVDPHFEGLIKAIEGLTDEAMISHGFTQAQLDFKLGLVERTGRRFFSLGGGKLFIKLIDAIDNVLESIIAGTIASMVGATGAGGAIKEFKDGLRSFVDDER